MRSAFCVFPSVHILWKFKLRFYCGTWTFLQHWWALSVISTLKDVFKKASLLDPPGALSLFSFFSFWVFNVTRQGNIGTGSPQAFSIPTGWQSHALLLRKGINPVWVVSQSERPQLHWVEKRLQFMNSAFWMPSINPLMALSSFFVLFGCFYISQF